MARNLKPKCKQERREGVKLGLKGEKSFSSKHPIIKRPYAPGQHGPSANMKMKKVSGYGVRLREKQKVKKIYRLLEKEFRRYYDDAFRASGVTAEILIKLLESRLDNVVYRLGYADSRDASRQLVRHGHILINGKKCDIPSYRTKVGEVFTVKKSVLDKPYWKNRAEKLGKIDLPGWLSMNSDTFTGKIVALPEKNDLSVPFDPALIIEFYSR